MAPSEVKQKIIEILTAGVPPDIASDPLYLAEAIDPALTRLLELVDIVLAEERRRIIRLIERGDGE